MALKLAFLGYDARDTSTYLRQFVEDNADQVAGFNRTFHRVFLKDQTEIIGIINLDNMQGNRFDQVIIADDRRHAALEKYLYLSDFLYRTLAQSEIPEEWRVQIYDIDEERPK